MAPRGPGAGGPTQRRGGHGRAVPARAGGADCWLEALQELAAREERIEIRIRNEPLPHQRALMEALGADIVIDPRGPFLPSPRRGGRPTRG